MATVNSTSVSGAGARAMSQTTLTGTADTFTYMPGRGQMLILRNPTAAPISPVIDGDGGTTVGVQGIGAVDVSGGYAVGAIAAGAAVIIPLDSISEYLRGVIAINSGTGIIATLIG